MSGLIKTKKYDKKDSNAAKIGSEEDKEGKKEDAWRDTNVGLIGSDLDKEVKEKAAETEEAWEGCEESEDGIKIWRIEKFKVVDWPKEKYGTFHNGDSYIILHSIKLKDSDIEKEKKKGETEKEMKINERVFNVHFWIGKDSTQDEYATAAYKTVELDTYLYDAAVQHREVEGHESDKFKSYFKNGLETIKGGIASGFNHVNPEEELNFEPMVKHFHKVKVNGKFEYQEVDMEYSEKNFECGDGYSVIFSGDRITQINGRNTKLDYVVPFNMWMAGKKTIYCKAKHDVYDSLEEYLKDQDNEREPGEFVKKLIRLRLDRKDQFTFVVEQSASGGELLNPKLLDTTDVFLVDTLGRIFVWIGEQASKDEKKHALHYAQSYLEGKDKKDKFVGITVLRENKDEIPEDFLKVFDQEDKANGQAIKGVKAKGQRKY